MCGGQSSVIHWGHFRVSPRLPVFLVTKHLSACAVVNVEDSPLGLAGPAIEIRLGSISYYQMRC
jgi:hypothetical protein